MAEHNEVGKIGENIAATFLMKQGFSIVERNYRTKYGEIDIIAIKDKVTRFIEVKSIKVRGVENIENLAIRPEDNFTQEKWRKVVISIESYLKHTGKVGELYQVDLACVYIDTEKRKGRVKLISNVHL